MHPRLLRRLLPSFLPSTCRAPALTRVCGRFGRKRPFEIYRHLSTPATIADTVGAHPRRSGKRPRRAVIERLKLLSRLNFSPIFLPSRCRTGGVVESHHQDRSTRTSRRTIWRSQINLKHSGRALHQRTVLTVHCGLGRCRVRSRRSPHARPATADPCRDSSCRWRATAAPRASPQRVLPVEPVLEVVDQQRLDVGRVAVDLSR